MALKDDLIQRTIEQLAEVTSVLLNLKTSQNIEQAEQVIAKAYQQHTGSSADLFRQLPTEQLLAVLSSSGMVDREKSYLLACIFYAESRVAEAKTGSVSPALLLKSLDLFLEAGIDEVGEDDIDERIQAVLSELNDFVLPEETHWRLFDYAHYTGNFSEAEDKLFSMLAKYGSSSQVTEKGRSFYKRLLQMEDDELEKGDLPRAEVEEGRADFEAQLKTSA